MTVAVTTTSNSHTGNGSQTTFAYTFAALASDELQVTVNDVVIASNQYSVSRDTTDNQGGTITFLSAPANGAAIVISSDPSFEQGIDADNAGAFNLASIEEAFDRCAIRDLYLLDLLENGELSGPAGPQGAAGTITVGAVTTGAAGSSVQITNSGTASAAVLDFVIPRGDTGATGATGAAATNPSFSVATGLPGTDVVLSGSYPNLTLTIPRGSPGASGALGDGTYGDIVVSGTGSVLTVGNGAISVAKMANMAANTVMANITGGAAAPAAVTKANFITWLALAQADVAGLVAALAAKADLASPALTATIQRAKEEGHDGVIIRNFDDAAGLTDVIADHFIVFDPTQIKSAIGNQGTFDPNDPNILRDSVRGAITITRDEAGFMSTALIRAFETANFSTAVHELGHFFLEDLRLRALSSAVQARTAAQIVSRKQSAPPVQMGGASMKRVNPYRPGTDQYRAWNKGYAAANADWIQSIQKRPAPKPARWRESKLGRFVTKAFALANPDTTTGERR